MGGAKRALARWRDAVGASQVWPVIVEELRRGSSRTFYRVMTFAVPVLLLVVAIAAPVLRSVMERGNEGSDAGPNADRSSIIVDRSGLLETDMVVGAGFQLITEREAGIATLLSGEVSAVFVVAADYVSSGQVEWLHTGSALSAAVGRGDDTERLERLLRRTVLANRLSLVETRRFLEPVLMEQFTVRTDGTVQADVGEVGLLSVSYLFAVLLMMSIFTGSGFLQESIADEKENRMIEVLVTSVSPFRLMAGKVFGMGAIGLVQVGIWVISIAVLRPIIAGNVPGLGGLHIDASLLIWAVAFFLAGYFVLSVIMAGIGAATTSYREASQVSLLVLMPAVMPVAAFQLIAGNPDGVLGRVLSFIPITAPITMMLRLGESDVAVAEILASLVVTFLGGLGFLWASAKIFRAGILLYGQRMSVRGVVAALRT